jgi:hypothetical protein
MASKPRATPTVSEVTAMMQAESPVRTHEEKAGGERMGLYPDQPSLPCGNALPRLKFLL